MPLDAPDAMSGWHEPRVARQEVPAAESPHITDLGLDEEGDVKGGIEQEVVELSSKNPKWITITTQAIVFVNLIYFIGKIFY